MPLHIHPTPRYDHALGWYWGYVVIFPPSWGEVHCKWCPSFGMLFQTFFCRATSMQIGRLLSTKRRVSCKKHTKKSLELSDNTTIAIAIKWSNCRNSDSITIVSKLLISSKHHSLLLLPLAVELETVFSGYSRCWNVDLLTCYQTQRGRVPHTCYTPQASYHPVHWSLHFANTQGHVLLLAHALSQYSWSYYHYCW